MTVKITGIDEVDNVLQQIAPRHALNLMRSTTADVAKELAKDSLENAPTSEGAPSKGGAHFASKKVIKHGRDRMERGGRVVSASVRVFGPWRSFWKMLENGTNDTPEFGMFMKAVETMRPKLKPLFLESFKKKLAAAVAREKKKMI
jgi:hypothetical protein